jgi:hypothetical protein
MDGKRHSRLTIGVSEVKAAGHVDVKTPSTCQPPQQDRSLENGEMEKERHATATAHVLRSCRGRCGSGQGGEFKRGRSTASRQSSAGRYLDPPLVFFVLISGLSYNTTFNKELWISSFPL